MKIAVLTTDNRENFRNYGESQPSFGTAPAALLQGFAQTPEVEVHVVSCTQLRMSSPEKLAKNIWFHCLHVPRAGWMRSGYLGCISAVRRKLKEIGPDVVHGQGTERDCSLSAVFSGLPNVLTIHGNMRLIAVVNQARPFSFEWLAARLERITIPRSDGVICITKYTREAVKDLAHRTWIVPNAVDQSFFEQERSISMEPVVLCVGAVCLRKNQNAFIRMLEPLAKDIPFKLIFAGGVHGGTPYGKEFLSLVRERDWCSYVGEIDHNSVKGILSSASLLALPTLEDNCPMVVLEAMAAGIPVAASRVGGIPDLVEHGITGVLFDPGDGNDVRAAVRKLLTEDVAAASLASAAKQRARERYLPKSIADRHLQIYREIIKN